MTLRDVDGWLVGSGVPQKRGCTSWTFLLGHPCQTNIFGVNYYQITHVYLFIYITMLLNKSLSRGEASETMSYHSVLIGYFIIMKSLSSSIIIINM